MNVTDDRGYNQVWGDSPATRVRAERRCDLLARSLNLTSQDSVLEIGCGLGAKSHRLAVTTGAEVLGTDLCVPFIEQAQQRFQAPRLSYQALDFNKPEPLMGRRFDVVLGDGILHHLFYNLEPSLRAMRALLKDGGRLGFLEPNLENPYVLAIFKVPPLRKLARLEEDEMAFTSRYAKSVLERAGFRDIKVEHRDFLLPGIPEGLVAPSIAVGAVVEQIKGLRHLSQSILVTGAR
jgi:SAM-dependent methyltransferase